MMNMLKKRLNKKGFTLAELLIVVAIIAVLVAVSIPIFTSRLEKARETTDIANMRAAKGDASTAYMAQDETLEIGASYAKAKSTVTVLYDADNGKLVAAGSNVKGYGQGTAADGKSDYTDYYPNANYVDGIIQVVVDNANGTVTVSWLDSDGNSITKPADK